LDHGTFKFGKDAHHLEHRLPSRGCGVYALLVQIQIHADLAVSGLAFYR